MRVVDIVRRWAELRPEQVCLVFHEREDAPVPVTYGALWRSTAAAARSLRARGFRSGDPIVILAHPVAGFVGAFLGAQAAGCLPVPCPPPELLESGRRVADRIGRILEHCRARAVVDPSAAGPDPGLAAALAARGVPLLTLPALHDAGDDWAAAPGDTSFPFAYCQFTSGTGGITKGVLLTHANVVAGIQARNVAHRLDPDDVAVSWLPLFHDMGLVGYVLAPLVTGFPAHLMPPARFIHQPASWLSLLSRTGGTVATAPNFAYALCARKITDHELQGLDLSRWRLALNGAEAVTREAVEAFVRRFGCVGFRRSALLPAYGLAEDTLTAASRRPGEGPRFEDVARDALERVGEARPAEPGEPVRTVASVGRPLPDHELAILGGDGHPLADRRVGEIAVRSPAVMHGYLPGTTGEAAVREDGWLLTGDFGYVVGGELFVVGRKKHVIVRAGRSYFPEDLEEAIGAVPGIRAGRLAVFAVPGPASEHVVVAAERQPQSEEDDARLRAAIAAAVFGTVRFVPDEITLLPPHALPLTTSGKVMRPVARDRYLEASRLADAYRDARLGATPEGRG